MKYIVILGYKGNKYILNERLKLGIDKMSSEDTVILTGTKNEINYMTEYLNSQKIFNIITENNSKNTYDNIKNTLNILENKEMVYIITSNFHAKRVARIIKSFNLNWMIFGIDIPVSIKIYIKECFFNIIDFFWNFFR